MTYPTSLFPLWSLTAGTRGGPTRAKILETLRKKPQNTNQLAHLLKMDYKTVSTILTCLRKIKSLFAKETMGQLIFYPKPWKTTTGWSKKSSNCPRKKKE